MKRKIAYLLAGCGYALMLGVPSGAHALEQEATPDATADANDAAATDGEATPDEGLSGDEIIVTARRRAERLQDVPLAITALSGETMQRDGIEDLVDLGAKVPGLIVTAFGGGRSTPIFAIRGQSQQELSAVVDPSVSLYVNDVVVPRAHGQNMSFFDIASIEVAKGPQGTLFGRNTTGGAILVRTQRPTDEFEASISQTIGNLSSYTTEGMINIPFGDLGGLRIAGQHVQRRGWLKDVVLDKNINSVNEDGIRGSLTLTPSDALKNELTAGYANADNGATGNYIFAVPPNSSALVAFAPHLAARGTLGFYETQSGVPQSTRIKNVYIDNTTTFEINDVLTLKNIFGYRRVKVGQMLDQDGTPAVLFTTDRAFSQNQISEELQLQGSFDALNFIFGGFFFREKVKERTLSTGTVVGIPALVDPVVEPSSLLDIDPRYSATLLDPRNKSAAVFFQGDLKLSDQFSITAGIRQNWDWREVRTRNRALRPAISNTQQSCRFTLDLDNNPATPETLPTLAQCDFTAKTEFNELTYNLSAQFRPARDVLTYIAHRHGYRSGGFGPRGSTQRDLTDPFEPEIVDDYEVGVKADWHFSGMFLRTNLAMYRADYKDMQRTLIEIQPGNALATLTTNAGSASIQGVELEMLFRPNDIFELSGSYAYTDAKFKRFIDPSGNDLSAQRFPRAPKNQYTITAAVMPPLGSGAGDARFSISYNHLDKYDYNDDYAVERNLAGVLNPTAVLVNQLQIIGAQNYWNANAEWKNVMDSAFDVSVFVENLTKEKYLLPYIGVQNSYETRTPNMPRTYGIRVKKSF